MLYNGIDEFQHHCGWFFQTFLLLKFWQFLAKKGMGAKKVDRASFKCTSAFLSSYPTPLITFQIQNLEFQIIYFEFKIPNASPLSYLSSLSKFEIHLLPPSNPQRKLTAHLKTKRLIWSPLLLKQMLKTKEKSKREKTVLHPKRLQWRKKNKITKPTIISLLLIRCKIPNSPSFSFADKPNLPDLPRRRVYLLQREPAGIIQPAASINFETKKKNPPLSSFSSVVLKPISVKTVI